MHRFTIFFFVKLISTKILSVLFEFERRRLAISSLMLRRIPPPFRHLSSLYGIEKPLSRNCAEVNETAILVSDIRRISKLAQTLFSRNWNFFLIEFILTWAMMRRFKFFCLSFLRLSSQHSSSLSMFPSHELVVSDGFSEIKVEVGTSFSLV